MSATLLTYLRRHYTPPVADADLLRSYCATQDHAAFQAIVERHGPMVLGACRRRLGQADADDAFQAVFLLLTRKCRSIRRPEVLAGWLHGAAQRICARSLRTKSRRVVLEHSPSRPSKPLPLEAMTARELFDALDAEVARLTEREKLPLLLVYWQGRTQADAATALGVTRGALAGLLDRGRKRIGDRLRRRGFGEGDVRGLLMAPVGAAVVSGELMASTAALTISGATVPAGIAALTSGLSVAKITASIMAVVAACGFGLYAFATIDQPAPSAKPTARADTPPMEPAAARNLRVVVLDPQGQPLDGASIQVGIWTNEKDFNYKRKHVSDAKGSVEITLPASFYIVRLWAEKGTFVSMCAAWEQDELAKGITLPSEFTFQFKDGVAIGGRVVSADGKAIAGAQVKVRDSNSDQSAASVDRARPYVYESATTDAEGRWRILNAPNSPTRRYALLVSHPDYIADEFWEESQKAAGISTAMLYGQSAVTTLKSGVVVRGRVVDPAGQPVKDAIIVYGDRAYFPSSQRDFATDANGQFQLPPLRLQSTHLTVIAPGWAPQMRAVEVKSGMAAQEFRLTAGTTIKLQLVDSAGKPMPRAYVTIRGWRGHETLYNRRFDAMRESKIPQRADNDGIWEWTWAPEDPVKLSFHSISTAAQELEIAGGSSMRTVVLQAPYRVTGNVTDANTGQPIPTFTVIPIDVFRKDWLNAERQNAQPGKDGKLDYLAERIDIPTRVRIEAPGYRTQDGPEYRVGDDDLRIQHFRLLPSAPVTGTVVDGDGRPVGNAIVLMGTPSDRGKLFEKTGNNQAITAANGRFTFPDPGEPFAVTVQADGGFAQAQFPMDQHDIGTLRIRPWASVRGQLHDGGRVIPGARIFLRPIRIESGGDPSISVDLQMVTDAEGRFEFPRVPAVPVSVWTFLGPWKDEIYRSGPTTPLDLQPGQRVDLKLGSGGCTVTGHVKLTGKVPNDLDCNYSLNYLVRRSPGIAPPPEIAKLGFDVRNGWREAWRHSQEGMAYLHTLQHWFVKLARDGSFRISGVPAGDYDLAFEIYAKPSGCLTDPLARQTVRVTVTEEDVARAELAVPEITAQVVPIPDVGDTPTLSFQRPDGTQSTLADHRGKFTVVHFWASWCVPCKKQIPSAKSLHDRFAERGLTIVGLSLDNDVTAWKAALQTLNLPWSQGRLAAASEAGVSSVPVYWLLDPAGKIIAKTYELDELIPMLTGRLK